MKLLFSLLAVLVAVPPLAAQDPSAFGNGQGVNGEVLAVAVQSDGKIVIGGRFASVNGQPRNNIARLNADGTLDPTFAPQPNDGVNGVVNAITIDSSGGVIAGGQFTQAGPTEAMNLVRYMPDGTVDRTFGAGTGLAGVNGVVQALATQPDGKILIGGNFSTVFGQQRRSIARINTDGTLDGPVTAPNALSGTVQAVGAAGSVAIAGGQFTVENQTARNLIQIAPPAGD